MRCSKCNKLILSPECTCWDLKPCPNPECDEDSAGICYSDEDGSDPAVACITCGLLVMSMDGIESETVRLWNLLPRVRKEPRLTRTPRR